ncbi:putative phosphoadenosine phosphosulfate reductase [Monocercomonoides exilis]|uniref:putative phosphoadenosine phosphosulfate reductase n=1 Tax=Monocercomonoides exilis TaxID=2049356 RepID=UPI00355A6EE7|nr:putative phosphoadenosine phosphosulfate reductase [Monocercomonoides exilis]|eukprot:MONOS_6041.1-p1 / transcript=MONOS_6041.1 / gene=MONOS_6041 / organism=Monocercomonoides_exilis_PA203 / gene_product=GF23240 / transcript_product=GF23240 / location=Mono_scaffold00185:33115-34082(-) / protein_length=243 / sequence_SO=supercontig / SO=protein_coding / is_pseudo=false
MNSSGSLPALSPSPTMHKDLESCKACSSSSSSFEKDSTTEAHIEDDNLKNKLPSPQLINSFVTVFVNDEVDEFDEVREFVLSTSYDYGLKLMVPTMKGLPFITIINRVMGDHLTAHKSVDEQPPPLGVLLGVRRSDPRSDKLECFTFSDVESGWPPMLRIFPIIDWGYFTIWSFLQLFNVPFVSLYRMGYTSLGPRKTTVKNPHLAVKEEGSEEISYRPAWLLEKEEWERDGRIPSSKKLESS